MAMLSALRHVIRTKIDAGELPSKRALRFSAGLGEGHTCAACGTRIGRKEVEWSIADGDRLTYRFHADCYEEWDAEVARPEAGG